MSVANAMFEIVLDTPPDQLFQPGSEVSGTLVHESEEPQSYRFVQIVLFGRARVSVERMSNGRSLLHGRRKFQSAECLLPADAFTVTTEYVNIVRVVWTREDSPDGQLNSGRHEFRFRLSLPADIPSSFKGPHGDVCYFVEASAFSYGLAKEAVAKEIIVSEFVELQTRDLNPVKRNLDKDSCFLCSPTSPVLMTVELPRTGCCVGESIPLCVTLENLSKCRVSISAVLVQRATYEVRGKVSSSLCVVMNAQSNPILAGAMASWDFPEGMKLPLAMTPTTPFPSPRNRVIYVSYVLIVGLSVPWSRNMSVNIPIFIGTQPSLVAMEN